MLKIADTSEDFLRFSNYLYTSYLESQQIQSLQLISLTTMKKLRKIIKKKRKINNTYKNNSFWLKQNYFYKQKINIKKYELINKQQNNCKFIQNKKRNLNVNLNIIKN
ncbi:hypothetical protein TTHERM_000588909 (macronuclear) [Tetrahymena thermophila SB210]|uniref:Uncharacterized protein n=1 Tax=Tetrahymena thermophila (strain SB210) TaxID=312017 RepID=W7X2I0_TETTS|nr:hypothetical protein TTHERM_000588909 [Tetrahymena thermophila SB210]EWS73445.1 hypothetical protein TTHERM_000588909 [Tetrahymena thermophila SB210]|eukprot:XP_012654016.1 hypothetical protein TTHERM_000588909 [Tetrahymena thermophila SB210]